MKLSLPVSRTLLQTGLREPTRFPDGLLRQNGLRLSAQEKALLRQEEDDSLLETGRLAFGQGILPALLTAFADSPFLTPEELAPTAASLTHSFYAFQQASGDRLTDEELLGGMRLLFDRVLGGDPEGFYLVDWRDLYTVCRQKSLRGTLWAHEAPIGEMEETP